MKFKDLLYKFHIWGRYNPDHCVGITLPYWLLKQKVWSNINFDLYWSHWGRDNGVQHGPQTWPWWRLISFGPVLPTLGPDYKKIPSICGRLWIYTRWGVLFVEYYINRRK